MRSTAELGELRWSERWLLVEALVLLLLMRLSLKLLGFRRCYAAFGWLTHPQRSPAADPEGAAQQARRIAQIVTLTNRRYALYEVSCLPESLTLWWLLRRRGLAADLRLGARTITGTFQAHAWTEYAGQVLNDRPDIAQVYVPFELAAQSDGARLS